MTLRQALQEVAEPHQKKLDAFLANGGSVYEFAIAYPIENAVILALVSVSLKTMRSY